MMLLGAVAGLGLGTLLITEMPRHTGRELGLIATALGLLFQAVLMTPRVRRALGGEPVSRGVLG